MPRFFFLLLMFVFFNCQKEEQRCGQIIQKVNQNDSYYFVLQTDEYSRSYGDFTNPEIADDGIRQGSVSKEIYDAFEVGDEYCAAG